MCKSKWTGAPDVNQRGSLKLDRLGVRSSLSRILIPYQLFFPTLQNSEVKLNNCLTRGDIFLVLYSITDRSSFHEAARIGRHIRRRKTNGNSVMIILIGTKRDLEHFREVDETEGSDLSQELECPFYEISVASSDGYKEVSEMLSGSVRQYLRHEKIGSNDKRNQPSSLSKMKEGLIKKTGSFRRKSVTFWVVKVVHFSFTGRIDAKVLRTTTTRNCFGSPSIVVWTEDLPERALTPENHLRRRCSR